MLRRIRSRITPSGVIATIALFAALGGGYAVAFKGSGSLQKAGQDGLPTSFADFRTLKGFGKIQVRCDTTDDEVEYRLVNTTSKTIGSKVVRASSGEISAGTAATAPGANQVFTQGGDFNDELRWHLYKTEDDNKAQVDIVTQGQGPQSDNCGTAWARLLALNTQQ